MRKIVDHASATQKCVNRPAAASALPPPNAPAPNAVEPTPIHSAVTVDPYTNALSTLENTPSTTAVSSHARTNRAITSILFPRIVREYCKLGPENASRHRESRHDRRGNIVGVQLVGIVASALAHPVRLHFRRAD